MRRFVLPLLLILPACSPLGTFDSLVPKDGGTQIAAKDARFAPGARGTLDIYAPRNRANAARLPVIVFFYGGSWRGGAKGTYGFAARALAAQGFIVALPDYRLFPEVRFPTFLQDNAAAVKWVRANIARYGGDPDRIVLAGHSAGAYNAAMLSVDPRWLGPDRAAVKGLVALSAPYAFLPLDVQATIDTFGQAPDLPATQPINFASRDDPPALLIGGGADELVSPRQGPNMAAALTKAGGKAEAIVYPGVGHVGTLTAFARLFRGKAPVLRDVVAFARRVTAEPPPAR